MAIRVGTSIVLVSILIIASIGCSSSSTSDGSGGAPGASGSSGGTPAQSGATGLSGAAGATLAGTAGMAEGGSRASGGTAGTAGRGGNVGADGGTAGTGAGGTPQGGSSGQAQGGSSAGSAGAGAGSGGTSGGGSAFSEVQAIFDARCITCHDKSKVGLPSYPALSLVAGDARMALVNQPALETCGGKYVVPGAPEQSYLLKKLSEQTPCDGVRMPRPFEVGVVAPLSDAELATIRSWISAGAH